MKQTTLRLRVVTAAAMITLGAGLGAASSAAAAGYTVQSETPWLQNAAPVGWTAFPNPNRVFYDSLGANGMFNGWSANPDGSSPVCLTCQAPSFPDVGTATNRGISDVSPNGRYMLVTVERSGMSNESAIGTQPGKGGGNDVYLYSTDGKQAWPLTNIYALGSGFALGSIWPRFDRTGTEIVWSSMLAPAVGNLGYWELKVANIVWSNGVPSLANIRVVAPASNTFYEPYGFTPDDQKLLFASNATGGTWLSDQIDEVGTDGTGLTQVSQTAPTSATNYNEFAFFTPSNDAIIYARDYNTRAAGMDYWTMNPDGSNPQRLTYFNEPWNSQYLGYSDTEALVFNPNNPMQFLTGIAHDPNSQGVNAELVTLARPSANNELSEQFYSGQSFNQLITSSSSNLANGFESPGAPAPGVPSTFYSIRWTGGISIPVTGVYTFCGIADANIDVYLNNTELINAPLSYGTRACGQASEVAGTVVPIRVDYWHGVGGAYAQLSWIPPNSTSASPNMVPASALQASTPAAVASSIPLVTYGIKSAPDLGTGSASPAGGDSTPAGAAGSGDGSSPVAGDASSGGGSTSVGGSTSAGGSATGTPSPNGPGAASGASGQQQPAAAGTHPGVKLALHRARHHRHHARHARSSAHRAR